MSLQPDGSYRCDRCGGPAGNGGVIDCAVISDARFGVGNTIEPYNLHLCRANRCVDTVLAPANLPAFYAHA